MSDIVIRVGGSHLGNTTSINNLKKYLAKSKSRKFVVVSAIPGLLELLNDHLFTVLEKGNDNNEIREQLLEIYRERIGMR